MPPPQAVEYGAEAVDPDIREDNIDVKYMDLQGVERRVGAKTPFDGVKRARLLRITRKPIDPFASPKNQEKLGLVGGSRKSRPVPKRCAPHLRRKTGEGGSAQPPKGRPPIDRHPPLAARLAARHPAITTQQPTANSTRPPAATHHASHPLTAHRPLPTAPRTQHRDV